MIVTRPGLRAASAGAIQSQNETAVTPVEQSMPKLSPNTFWRVVETAMILAFISMLVVMFIQIAARYALSVAVPWTDESSRFLYIAQIFLGLSIAQRYGQHIRVTVALDLMPLRMRRITEALADLLTALIGIALIVGAAKMMVKSGSAMASTLPLRMSVIYGVQGVGLFLYTVLVLKDVRDQLFAPAVRETRD